jgi:hypothetical protein
MNYRNVTGKYMSWKHAGGVVAFESTLERDLFILLNWNSRVDSFLSQPVTIDYDDGTKKRKYTPDVLIRYANKNRPPLLVEVKHRKDLKKDWAELKPKFRAAIHYAKQHGMRFKIMTEVEIRTQLLKNIIFLEPFSKFERVEHDDVSLRITDTMAVLRQSTPRDLISSLMYSEENQAKALRWVWRFIYDGRLETDLTRPLTMNSPIWLCFEYDQLAARG